MVKRFHSRRSYRDVAALWAALVVLVAAGVLLLGLGGKETALLVVLAGGAAAVLLGRKKAIEYELHADNLLLRRGADRAEVPLDHVMDANLIDLSTARGYLHHAPGQPGSGERPRVMTAYCAVPLRGIWAMRAGLSRWSANQFKRNLVLLRTRDGGVVVLSPRYSESMVSAIGKALEQARGGPSAETA